MIKDQMEKISYFHIEEQRIIDVPGKRGIHKAVYAFMEKGRRP